MSSNLTPCTTLEPRYSKMFAVLWSLRSEDYSESTSRGYGKKLKTLANLVCLDDSERVKAIITAKSDWSIGCKQGLINAYSLYAEHFGLAWISIKYNRPQRVPNIPSHALVDGLLNPCDVIVLSTNWLLHVYSKVGFLEAEKSSSTFYIL